MEAGRQLALSGSLRFSLRILRAQQRARENSAQFMQDALAHGRWACGEHPHSLGHELESEGHRSCPK